MRPRTIGLLAYVCVLGAVAAEAAEIRLMVEEPSGVQRASWPVTCGIPFAQGTLNDPLATALFDAGGAEVPLQTEALAHWSDGSIRWLLLDFQVTLKAHEHQKLLLKYGAEIRRAPVERPLLAQRIGDGKVAIDTGPIRLEYDSKMFQPQGFAYLKSAAADGSDRLITINCGSAGIILRDAENAFRPHNPNAAPAEMSLEQKGPLRACLVVKGVHTSADSHLFRYITRIHVYRGQPWIRVEYTFVNDAQDALMKSIREVGIRFYVRDCSMDANLLGGERVRRQRVFQIDENQYLLDDKVIDGRAQGWAAVGGENGGMAVGLRHFWQNWPKAIDCTHGRIALDLCPPLPEGLYDGKPIEEENKLYYALRGGQHTFKIGAAKTHEFCVNYLAGRPDAQALGTFFRAAEEPLLATADPHYVSSTQALGAYVPADEDALSEYDTWIESAFERHLRRREQQREYGMLNFGDWYGERRVNWGNLEYDLAHGMFLQYLRSGDRRYFERGEQAARHHIDVDVVHATNPWLKNPWGPPPQVGEIWLHCLNHTGGYYEDAPLPVSNTYQMGHSTNFGHVWSGGDFELYLLTGNRHALDVALSISDAMVKHCPTRYSDHIRGLGWPIILVLNAYDVTSDQKYLDAATSCWQVLKENIDWRKGWVVRLAKGHCVHPEQTCYGNVPFMEGLTISALARYHRVTQDPEVLRAMTVGIDQMIRECWVEQDKAFRYTACPLSTPRTYISVCLAAEGMAYEAQQTGNAEHRRILREGLQEMMRRTGSGDGKSLAQLIHFTPYALDVLRD